MLWILDGEAVSKVGGVDASVAQFVKWVMPVMLPHVFPSHTLFYFFVMLNLSVIIKVVVSVILSFTSEHNEYSFGYGSFHFSKIAQASS